MSFRARSRSTPPNRSVTLTFANTRTVGDLVVKKVVVGPIEGVSTDFTVNVDCTPGTAYDKTGVLNEANNWTVTYTGIPTGVSCVVTEPVVPAGWTLTSIAPSPAVVGSSPVTVTVTNTRKRHSRSGQDLRHRGWWPDGRAR